MALPPRGMLPRGPLARAAALPERGVAFGRGDEFGDRRVEVGAERGEVVGGESHGGIMPLAVRGGKDRWTLDCGLG